MTAGAGCRLEEVNQFLLPKGRFLPAGSCRTVGLAGLTLGGGYGMFARKWGLTCDHLRRVKMVYGAGIIRDSNEEPMVMTTTVTWLPFMIQAENASLGNSEVASNQASSNAVARFGSSL